MRIGSLFSGIGGLELGLERAGVGRTVWQCECDEYALAVLAKHWPDAQRFKDVRVMDETTPTVDVICGGFPCQDISNAGRRDGITGERSGLFFELMRVVRMVRPRFVVLENVAALLGRGFGAVLGELSACGFDAEWDCVPASSVGAHHQRDRVFILAYPHGDGMRPLAGPDRGQGWEPAGASEPASLRPDQRAGGVGYAGAGGEAVADAHQGGLARRRFDNAGWSAFIRIERDRGWLPEPDVGGTIDGFSAALDGCALIGQSHERIIAYGNASQTGPSEIMQAVRDFVVANDVQRETGGSICVSSSDVLFAYLRELARHCEKGNTSLARAQNAWSAMRGVRIAQKPTGASRRPRSVEQRSGQHSDALQALSRLLALDAEAAWVEYRGSNDCLARHWESGVARTAYSVPSRVDRLRCLGNAVVPQVAEVVGRRLMELAK